MWEAESYESREPVICPVCKSTLAARNTFERLWIYCKECQTNFYYQPGNPIPTRAEPDSITLKKSKKCGCGRCNH